MKIKNLRMILFTIILIWIPTIFGVLFYHKLPSQIPTHFDLSWQPDKYTNKDSFLFIFPLVMTGIHLLSILITSLDPKFKNIPKKILLCLYGICPLITIICSLGSYAFALKYDINLNFIESIGLGLLFLFIGNYLPKLKQNYSVGIKTPWTLNDDEVWSKTHIFGGKCFFVAGIIILITMFLDKPHTIIFLAIMVAVIIPSIYSYLLYRNKYKKLN